MKKLELILEKISNYVAVISFVSVFFLVLLNVADVIASKLLGKTIVGAYEISQCILMCAVFASFAYGQTNKTHVHMTLFIALFPGRLKFIPFFLCNVVSTVMAGILAYATFFQASRQLATNTLTGILHIPLFPFYYLAGACLVVFCITLLFDSVLSFLAIFHDKYGEEVRSHW